jgi:hypothetical protein
LQKLLDSASGAGLIDRDLDAAELILAVLRLSVPASEGDVPQARRMVALFASGLRS